MKKLLLHIGQHKTGTTAIQHFLADRRNELDGLGILYPHTGCHGNQHSLFAGVFLGDHAFLPKDRPRSLKNLVSKLLDEARNAHSIILSSEVLWELGLTSRSAFIDLLDSLSANFDMRIIYFVREPEELQWSMLKQTLRGGWIVDTFDIYESGRALYYPTVRALLNRYSPDPVVVPYEKAGDSVVRFVRACARLDGFEGLVRLSLDTESERELNLDSVPSVAYELLVALSNVLVRYRPMESYPALLPKSVLNAATDPTFVSLFEARSITSEKVDRLRSLHARHKGDTPDQRLILLDKEGILERTAAFLLLLSNTTVDELEFLQAQRTYLRFCDNLYRFSVDLFSRVDLASKEFLLGLVTAGELRSAVVRR